MDPDTRMWGAEHKLTEKGFLTTNKHQMPGDPNYRPVGTAAFYDSRLNAHCFRLERPEARCQFKPRGWSMSQLWHTLALCPCHRETTSNLAMNFDRVVELGQHAVCQLLVLSQATGEC